MNVRSQFKTNHRLLNLNLIIYSFEWLTYGAVFVLSFFNNSSYEDGVFSVEECRLIFTFDFFYWMVWVALFTRICLTSYMNVKFSRTL